MTNYYQSGVSHQQYNILAVELIPVMDRFERPLRAQEIGKELQFWPDLNIVFWRGSDSKNWKFINYLDDEDEVFVDEGVSLVIQKSSRCFSNIWAQAVFDYILFQ